jgi:digeranylgeranylglycerophospholipid reductase
MQARIVIDASGVAAVTTRLLGINKRFESVIGIQYEMQEIPTDGYLDFYLWPDLAPHGYLWMIPKNNGRANVGLVTNQNNKAKPFLDEFVRRLNWQEKKVVKTFGGLIPSSGPVENTVGDGLILVGDAAGFTSPLFEGGTHLSMKSGQYAAQVAQKALAKEDTSKEGLKEYEKLWKAEFPDYSALIKGKNALYDFTYEELNEVGRLMPQELSEISITQKAGIGFNLLLKKRYLMKKGVMDAFKAFAYSKAEHYGW